jgi:hypothetical protein
MVKIKGRNCSNTLVCFVFLLVPLPWLRALLWIRGTFDGDVCRGTTDQKASGIHAISCPKRNENSFPSRHACMHALVGLLRALAPAGSRKKGQWLFRGNGTQSAAVLRTEFTTIKG